MAPNISGIKAVDQPKAMYLAEIAVDLAQKVLKPKGDLLVKVFQGEGFDELFYVQYERRCEKQRLKAPPGDRTSPVDPSNGSERP